MTPALGIKVLSDILEGYYVLKMTGPEGQRAKCRSVVEGSSEEEKVG